VLGNPRSLQFSIVWLAAFNALLRLPEASFLSMRNIKFIDLIYRPGWRHSAAYQSDESFQGAAR
jgi:hypothetical protein